MRWVTGVVLLALGVLPVLSGLGSPAAITAGVLGMLVTAVGTLRDETRQPRPVPPRVGGYWYRTVSS